MAGEEVVLSPCVCIWQGKAKQVDCVNVNQQGALGKPFGYWLNKWAVKDCVICKGSGVMKIRNKKGI